MRICGQTRITIPRVLLASEIPSQSCQLSTDRFDRDDSLADHPKPEALFRYSIIPQESSLARKRRTNQFKSIS